MTWSSLQYSCWENYTCLEPIWKIITLMSLIDTIGTRLEKEMAGSLDVPPGCEMLGWGMQSREMRRILSWFS